MRLAVSRAINVESARGWRLDKLKQAHKIDIVVALSMACLAAIKGQGELSYPSDMSWVSGDAQAAEREFQEMRREEIRHHRQTCRRSREMIRTLKSRV